MKISRTLLPLLLIAGILCSLFIPSEGQRRWYGRSVGYRGGYGLGRRNGYGGYGRYGRYGRGYGYGRNRRYGYGRRRYG
uniref:Uncharacterized protein n=1 Tax=Magallana gigas TaxID=29159 RepID=K1RHC4_MAGGI